MDVSVTKLGGKRRRWALFTEVISLISLITFTNLNAQAGGYTATANSSTTNLFVQAPSFNPMLPQVYHQVTRPAVIEDQAIAKHLWPHLITYTPETDFITQYIKDDLGIGVQHNYTFDINLSAEGNNGNGVGVPDGWYQMVLAVVRMSDEQDYKAEGERVMTPHERFVTSTSMLVEIKGGHVNRRVSLRFSEVTATAIKHHLFIEFIPLINECKKRGHRGYAYTGKCITLKPNGEPDSLSSTLIPRPDYKPYLFEMPFVPYLPNGGKPRDLYDLKTAKAPFNEKSLAEYVARAQLTKTRQQLIAINHVTPAKHAATQGLHLMPVTDRALDYFSQKYLRRGEARELIERLLAQQTVEQANPGILTLTDEYRPLYAAFCEMLATYNEKEGYKSPSLIHSCRYQPQRAFHLTRVTHVGRPVPSQVKFVKQDILTYSLISNVMVSRSHTENTYQAVTFKPFSLVFKFLESVGLDLSMVDYSHTVGVDNSRTKGQTGLGSASRMMDFNVLVAHIPTVGSRHCLEVRPVINKASPFYNDRAGAKNGFYICAETSKDPVNVTEVYSHTFVRCRDTTLIDCYAPRTQSVNVMMRSDREISAFFHVVGKAISADEVNPIDLFAGIPNVNEKLISTPMSERLMMVTPVKFGGSPIPSFLEKFMGVYEERFPAGQ